MNRPAYVVVLAALADQDFIEIMNWTKRKFGSPAAYRYEALIDQALTDVGQDPLRPGTRQRPELPDGMYTYHLAASRDHVSGERVKAPRHFLLFHIVSTHVEVLRILHDSRDVAQHLPDA